MNHIFTRKRTIQNHKNGLFGAYVDSLATLLLKQGYSQDSIETRFRVLSDLNQWLGHRKLMLIQFDHQKVTEFLACCRRRLSRCRFRKYRYILNTILEDLRRNGTVPNPPVVKKIVSAIDRVIDTYVDYLNRERGLSPETQKHYGTFIRQFLIECFQSKPVSLQSIQGKEVYQYVLRHAPSMAPKTAHVMISSLRSFFRFAKLRGKTNHDLASCVPTVANRRLSHLPQFIEPAEVQLVLRTVNQKTALGLRDYAILLLLSRLGLRACEIVRLKLDDFDWQKGEMIIHGKGSRLNRFPLPQDIGDALVQYLKKGRPSCPTRAFFICSQAPYTGFLRSGAVSRIAFMALKKAGINPQNKGAHLFRHSAATQILRRGASLAEVGEVLRHKDINTTAIYAKVDLPTLRRLSQPWPRVSLGGSL